MNHHFYATKLSRRMVTGVTSIFPKLCALGGPLLQATLEFLETTLSDLILTILSQCGKSKISNQKVFRELLSLIDEKKVKREAIRRLIEFSFAHLCARHSESTTSGQLAKNGNNGLICLAKGTTQFRDTFDIPSALDRIHDRVGAWRSISGQPTSHNFVVYRAQAGYQSKTLRVGDNVGIILDLLTKPRRKRSIVDRFSAADAEATSGAIDDLLRRGVLRDCA